MKQQFRPMWFLMAGVLVGVGANPICAQQNPASLAQPQAAGPMKMLEDTPQPAAQAQPVTTDKPVITVEPTITQNLATGTQSASASSGTSGGAPPPELKTSPMRMLQDFEPAANEEYELGPGDEISLDFPGRPELAGKMVVGPDGRITLNLAGSIDVSNKTRTQVAKLIVDALAPYYKDLSVTVGIDKYGSNRVVVIGNVVHPGVIYFDDTPTLLDVIARAGMMPTTEGVAQTGSPTTGGAAPRDGIPERCAIYRGNDQVVWIDLRALLQSGSTMADMRLKRNDIVYIPAQQEVFVSVLGNVAHPGAVSLTPQSTLTSVLAQSGGLAEGSSGTIQIIQPSTGKTVHIQFKSLLSLKGADEVKLHPGDVIFVPQSGFYKATYVVQRLAPVTNLGAIAAYAMVP
jgi:polysaccharide biosynthesis/export protein